MQARYNVMKKLIFLLTIISLCGIGLSGCRGAKLATADEQMARGEYFDASKTYRKVYNKLTKKEERPLRGEVAFKMGEAHRQLNQSARAAAAYQNAIRYGCPDTTLQLRLAQMLHADGKYDAAIKAYEEYLMVYPSSSEARTGLEGAKMGRDHRKDRTRYVVKQSKLFNSRRSD